MKCEMCNENMNYNKEGSVQGFRCPVCGNWGVITTFIDEICMDEIIYSLYIKKTISTDVEKIRCIAKTANVNFIMAKQILEAEKTFILKAKAPVIKDSIMKLKISDIVYEIFPSKLIIFPIYTIKSFQNCFCVAMFRCCSGLYKKFCSKA